jgi:hypothetical protein
VVIPASTHRWTDEDFDRMSWHDNAFHGIRISEGEYGSGTLTFDIDYILDWVKLESGGIGFRIAPATLIFFEVTNLVVNIDYAKPTAGLTPFSVDSVNRTEQVRANYTAIVWEINLNWPVGSISFEATGFEQSLRSDPVLSEQQTLTPGERGDA